MKSLTFTIALVGIVAAGLWAAPPETEAPSSTPASPGTRSLSAKTPDAEQNRVLHNIELLIDDGIPGKEYAKQLDYFEIELGAEDAHGEVEYASHLMSPRPERRTGNRQDDPRITISWKRGGLLNLDRKMLTKAGINTKGKKLSLFFSRELEDQLFKLEEAYAGENVSNITRTLFKIRLKDPGPGYEFYIADLELKGASPGVTSASGSRFGKEN